MTDEMKTKIKAAAAKYAEIVLRTQSPGLDPKTRAGLAVILANAYERGFKDSCMVRELQDKNLVTHDEAVQAIHDYWHTHKSV